MTNITPDAEQAPEDGRPSDKSLERSVVEMAVSGVDGEPGIYVGGLWALRRSDSLVERGITHVLSVLSLDEGLMRTGERFKHLVLPVDDVDDEDMLQHMPRAVRFIEEGRAGGVFVHCAAGKSRSVTMVVAYLLWKRGERCGAASDGLDTGSTGASAVAGALEIVRRTRAMAEPNDGFMAQLGLWWEWGCPEDMAGHAAYQRWLYRREVRESVGVGQAPMRLRFEDEQLGEASRGEAGGGEGVSYRCRKCRRTLATGRFAVPHESRGGCQHVFIEPLGWMRGELQNGQMSGRLACPGVRCGAGVGRYDWKGIRCTCGAWVTPAFSLQRAKVDEERRLNHL